ncbi:S1 family peptidase [Micromonospora fluostatini]|uniref:S1 family peptidase n=1 Tax=Micromonospora fluostatini TaxID=1629071 RepID=A0ABY2DI50_9ACTN|nr:S1 family peptidase [Micromonospora fluostatini]
MRTYSRLASATLTTLTLLAAALPAHAAAPGSAATTRPAAFAAADPEAADRLVASRPHDFGGLYLDTAADALVIQVVDGPRAASARRAVAALPRATVEARGLTVSTTTRIDTVARSRAQLDGIKARVTADRSWATRAGAVVSEWYVDVFRNRVSVSVDSLTDEVRRATADRFGTAVALTAAPLAVPTSKQVDSSPWSAGAAIRVNGHDCSSGFTLVETATGNRSQLTAGHCGEVGQVVTQNGVFAGTITHKEYGNHDVARYSGSTYASRLYPALLSTQAVHGVDSFILLGSFGTCFGGASMGDMNCEGQITALSACASFSVGWFAGQTCDLVKATRTTVGYLAQDGDSGGPVFRRAAPIGTVAYRYWAIGMIIGRPGNDHRSAYFHPLTSIVPAGHQVAIG